MRFQQVALRQWNLDHLHQTGTPLELFPPAMLLHIFGIKWQYHIPNSEILSRAGFPSMHSLLSQRRLRWLGPVHRMDDGHIPKKVLYRQLITGVGKVGCAALRFKDAWKRDLKACEIDPNNWEDLRLIVLAWDGQWKKERESKCETSPESWRKARSPQKSSTLPSFNLIFPMCGRDCHSRIGLHSHTRSCRTTIDWLGRTYLVSRDFTCQLARSSQGGGGGGWGNIQDRSGISMLCFTKSEEWVLCFTT